MKVAVLTSVSENIADLAAITVPNKLEYCLRHGYTLISENLPYQQAVSQMSRLCKYLDSFDLLWCLDCDAIVTDMRQPVHSLACLGDHATACEEGIVEWNSINCGSVVWRDTRQARELLCAIEGSLHEWSVMPCGWQTWLAHVAKQRPGLLTVAPLRAFNSCVWNRPGNQRDEIGGHWQPGDFVYHPCGVWPMSERTEWIKDALTKVQR